MKLDAPSLVNEELEPVNLLPFYASVILKSIASFQG